MSNANSNNKIRNIAIIAHVDHGKTTLVDALLRQSGLFRANQHLDERAMDSNEIEKQRGITILSKCTAINWKDYTINILDTPGHADFGSEVERVMKMVDGVLLVVDSVEGAMPQTKFVLAQAMKYNLKVIVLVNKIDRAAARSQEVVSEVMELHDNLMEAPFFFGSGREGYASASLEKAKEIGNIYELFDKIVDYIPAPQSTGDKLQILVSMVDLDEHLGKILIGKVFGGTINLGETLYTIDQEGKQVEKFRVNKLFCFKGIKKEEIQSAGAGDIVAIIGADISTVNGTVVSDISTPPIKAPEIEPATLSIVISANTSPLAGKEGTKLTSRQIRERILKEAQTNVGITVTEMGESFEILGRGELQLSVLIENMRREGFELTVSAPKIIFKTIDGKKMEPLEELIIDVEAPFMGIVIEKIGLRGGEFVDMKEYDDRVRLSFKIPSRFILGYFNEFMSDTKGTGVISKQFLEYVPYRGDLQTRKNGVLVSTTDGIANAYAMDKLQDRGIFFIHPNVPVYEGMIIGEHSRSNDLDVNPIKGKQLTNVRSVNKDDAILLPPPRLVTLETFISWILEDECIEVTPSNIRLRKVHLKANMR